MKSFIGVKDGERVFISWELKDGKFSAHGDYWNKLGDDISQGGQCLDDILEDFPDNEQVQRIHRVWKQYHLNDMRAGSPRQMKVIKEEIEPKFEDEVERVNRFNSAHYSARREALDKIEKAKWNQQDNSERLLKKILDSIDLDKNKDTMSFRRYLCEKERVYISSFQRAKAVFLTRSTVIDLKRGVLPSPKWYDFVCKELDQRGLLRDSELTFPEVMTDSAGTKHTVQVAYKYGSKWLREEIPQDVIDEINSWEEKSYEGTTLLQKLVAKYVTSVLLVYNKDERQHRKLILKCGAEFDFSAGSAVEDINAEMILGCVLQDAEYGQGGFEATLEQCISEFGYEAKEGIKVAKALVDTYEKLKACGLWDEYQELMEAE